MAEKNKPGNNFILQAGILAAAGIISRIIGLLYRSPLDSIIGEIGLGYYQSAYSYYTIVLLISSYSIPAAVSKVIAQKLGVKEYRNAHRVFLCAMLYVLVVGGAASLFLFFGAGLFVEEAAVPVLRILAPTVFIYGILGVLRGYFQAHKSMVQTSVSQILEQIANAAVSIGAAYLLVTITMGTVAQPDDMAERARRGIYGAMGSAMGTGAGVFVALLFMSGMYALNRKTIHRRIEKDRHSNVESYGSIIRTITCVVTPFILSTAVYNLNSSVNTKIYTDIYTGIRQLDSVAIMEKWGIFSGKALTISNIPIAFASAMASAMLPSVAQLTAAGKVDETCRRIGVAVKTTMLISIPSAVGLFVLARPVTKMIFPSSTADSLDQAGMLLMTLSLSVVFYALSTLSSTVLQGLGRLNTPIINAGIALVIQTLAAFGLLLFTELDLYSIAIAVTLYSGIMCVLNQWAVRRAVGYRQEIMGTFVKPAFAALVMGIAAWLVYEGLYIWCGSMVIAVIPAMLVAVAVYFVTLILDKGVTEEELRAMPKGYLIVRAARKIKLL